MVKKIPTYRVLLNEAEDTGVYAVSLVDQPAIEVDWIKLSKEIDMHFAEVADKQMLYGPLLIPGKMIYRKNENTGEEYNIVFDAEVIEKIAQKYNKNKLTDKFNINHSGREVSAFLSENWLTRIPDASESYGFDLPLGTWFAGVKVEDTDFWLSEVRTEKVKGFSVEIWAGLELIEMSKKVEDIYFQHQTNEKLNTMELKTKDGLVLMIDGELIEGTQVNIAIADGAIEAAKPGDYELEDGTMLTLDENGIISKIKALEEEAEEAEAELETEVLALDPVEVTAIIQPMIDEFRAMFVEISARLDALEVEDTEEKDVVETLKTQVEKLAASAGATSFTVKNDAKIKNEEKLLSKIKFYSNK